MFAEVLLCDVCMNPYTHRPQDGIPRMVRSQRRSEVEDEAVVDGWEITDKYAICPRCVTQAEKEE